MKKVNFLCLVLLGLFFTACHSNDDTWGDWSMAAEFPGKARTCAVSFKIGDAVYVGLGKNNDVKDIDKTLRDFYKFRNGSWSKVDSFPDPLGRYGAVAFVIGNKAYVGTGFREGTYSGNVDVYYKDFYVYEVRPDGTEGWVKDGDAYKHIVNFPGEPRKFGVAFGFEGGKGYVGTGFADGEGLNDFWSFDPTTETWSSVNFDGRKRGGAVTFELGGKVVLCLGVAYDNANDYITDVYVFDPQTETFTDRKPLVDQDGIGYDNDYAQIPRAYAVAFTSNRDGGVEKGYIATGQGPSSKSCWEYNIQTDRWDEVTELPTYMGTRNRAVGFSMNGFGYTTTGGTNENTLIGTTTWRFTPGIEEDDDNDYAPVPDPSI